MSKYLIEVVEPSSEAARRHHVEAIRFFGSYFAAHATWIWKGSKCTRTMVMDFNDAPSALRIIPPNMRARAQITHLDGRLMHKQSGHFAYAS